MDFNYFEPLLDKAPRIGNFSILAIAPMGTYIKATHHMAEWNNADTLSYNKITVWNHMTSRLSFKKLEQNTKGFYFKDKQKSIYIKKILDAT